VTVEHWLVRQAGELPDLMWVAEIDFDTHAERGQLRYAGGHGLEGLSEPLGSRQALDAALDAFRNDGCQIDLVPPA
jgi:hypothetical protein